MQKPKQNYTLTVFIHGTILPIPSVKTFKNARRLRNGGFYQRYLDSLRSLSLFREQPIQDKGLQKIPLFDPTMHNSPINSPTKLIATLYHHVQQAIGTSESQETFSYYTFGWDGRLNENNRQLWAEKLAGALRHEIKTIKQKNPNLSITLHILAHSHGGNVALHLANVSHTPCVDRLVLFGTPATRKTTPLLTSPIFKKSYSFYSKSDLIQVLDIFSTKDCTHRTFSEKRKQPLPSSLTQIELSVDSCKPWHAEWWMLGTIPQFLYRRRFPLFPIPVAVFTPLLLTLTDTYQQKKRLAMILSKKAHFYHVSLQKREKDMYHSKISEKIARLDLDTMVNEYMQRR